MVAGLGDGLEVLAAEAHGLQTHMDEDFSAVVALEAHGVAGLKHEIHRGVAGGDDLVAGGLDGHALAEDFITEGGILHFLNGNGLTGHRSAQLHLLGLSRKQLVK